MRAKTFAGQVIAVLSRRASAFEQDPAEPQTFPGRLRALLSRRRRTGTGPLTPADVGQVTVIEESRSEAPEPAEPPVGRHVAPPWQQALEARKSFDFVTIRVLAYELRRHGPHVRLRVRAHPAFVELERSLDRGRRDLVRVCDLVRGGDRDRGLVLAHDLDPARDLALALTLARVLDRVLARVLARARELNFARDLARDLDLDLNFALRFARARAPARARDRVLDLDLDLDLDPARDLARVLDLDLALAHDLIRDFDGVLADLDGVLADLDGALHDFTTADLRDVDLAHVQLEGLRWSLTTQWPADWVVQITLGSVEVEPDVFEVSRGNVRTNTGVVG